MEQIPPHIRQQLARLAQIEQMLINVVTRRQQWEAELREIEHAIDEISKLPQGAVVYKSVSNLLFRVERDKALSELNERKETVELHIKTLQRQESLLRRQLEELRKRVSEEMSKLQGGGSVAEKS
ncbi:MAG: prefoldin subunit beta [Thermoprotei archaeon]|nr:MAG: prefoldin subunit beta [Thermoprotei archaeon]